MAPMTDMEARRVRGQIIQLRNQRKARAMVSTRDDPEATRLWDESQRLCRVLEDAGHPAYIQGEFD